jgi:hypothetical protein
VEEDEDEDEDESDADIDDADADAAFSEVVVNEKHLEMKFVPNT